MNFLQRTNFYYKELNDFTKKHYFSELFKILYMNINRIQNKMERFEEFLFTTNVNPDVIALTETFLKETEENSMQLKHFNAVHLSRVTRSGGGVTIFVKENIYFETILKESKDENDFIIIHLKELRLYIMVIYRPPHTDFIDFLNHFNFLIEKFLVNKSVMIFGDFNLNLLEHNLNVMNYKTILQSNALAIINQINQNYPTRLSNNSSIIDHVITSVDDPIHLLYEDTNLSDHKYLLLGYRLAQVSKKIKKNFQKINVLEVQKYIDT